MWSLNPVIGVVIKKKQTQSWGGRRGHVSPKGANLSVAESMALTPLVPSKQAILIFKRYYFMSILHEWPGKSGPKWGRGNCLTIIITKYVDLCDLWVKSGLPAIWLLYD